MIRGTHVNTEVDTKTRQKVKTKKKDKTTKDTEIAMKEAWPTKEYGNMDNSMVKIDKGWRC